MPKKFDNLSALDWDDTALQKIYDEGIKEVRRRESEINSKEDKQSCSKKKNEWRVGDFCRTVYYADGLMYEAKVKAVSDNTCTVEFLGYDEEVEVDVGSMSESRGKKARKKQVKRANITFSSANGSISSDGKHGHSASQSPVQTHSKKKGHNRTRMFDHFADNTTAENTFHSVCPIPMEMPPTSMMPPAPPMPQCSEVTQNPSLCAMITSWYMAGYYTGLHQAQKNKCHQYCCCRPTQSFCHHPH